MSFGSSRAARKIKRTSQAAPWGPYPILMCFLNEIISRKEMYLYSPQRISLAQQISHAARISRPLADISLS